MFWKCLMSYRTSKEEPGHYSYNSEKEGSELTFNNSTFLSQTETPTKRNRTSVVELWSKLIFGDNLKQLPWPYHKKTSTLDNKVQYYTTDKRCGHFISWLKFMMQTFLKLWLEWKQLLCSWNSLSQIFFACLLFKTIYPEMRCTNTAFQMKSNWSRLFKFYKVIMAVYFKPLSSGD